MVKIAALVNLINPTKIQNHKTERKYFKIHLLKTVKLLQKPGIGEMHHLDIFEFMCTEVYEITSSTMIVWFCQT